MLISHQHRFIFIHVYKVAGISVRQALRPYAPRPLWLRALHKLGVPLPWWWRAFPPHIRAHQLQTSLPPAIFDQYFKFAFVRNPWDWQVSLYHYMLQEPTHHQHALIKSLPDFTAYITWRVSQDKKLQSDFITAPNGELIVDFVGKYENLAADFARICDHLHINATLPHLNQSAHRPYQSYYTPHTRDLIAQHFAPDIERLGYTFE